MKIVPLSKEECCGCTACLAVCPVEAITMTKDQEGFAYPVVDQERCIKCGLCGRMCAFANHETPKPHINTAYVAKHRDTGVRMNSRSGAVFVAMSDWILSMKGVVYGCVLDHNLHAVHCRATSQEQRDLMCKSKYVQSDMTGIIPMIAQDLQQGRYVMYSGTGCQVDGVLSALYTKKVDCSRLYTVDIVCHGVPSPLLFEEYIAWIEHRYEAAVTTFQFRDKEACGWDGHVESFTVNGKKHYSTRYREIFYTNMGLRPSCYHCKNCTVERKADLTIADAWGIKKALPGFNDNRGVSMFLVQSEKGNQLLEKIRDACDVAELPLQSMMQYNMQRPSAPRGNREEFWNVLWKKGFGELVKQYGTLSLSRRITSAIKYQVRRVVQSSRYYLP